MKISFFGHRLILNKEKVENELTKLVDFYIKQGVNKFLVGSHGDFDKIALNVCRKLKNFYNITICVVLTSLNMILKKNDFSIADIYSDVETCLYPIEELHYKQKITASNKFMIDDSDIIICYLDTDRYSSGCKKAINYAKQKKKIIINICQN